MKSLRLLLAAVTFGAASLGSFAAATTDTTAELARHPGFQHRRALLPARIAKRLGLSEAQREQMKAHRATTRETVKAIRKDASLTADQKRAKLRETLHAARDHARSILTPEQQTKLRHLKQRGHRIAQRRGLRR